LESAKKNSLAVGLEAVKERSSRPGERRAYIPSMEVLLLLETRR
jgi:hypothetical protein